MIKIENKKIEMGGLVIELLDDFSIITANLYRLILSVKEADEEMVKSLISYAFNYGLSKTSKLDFEDNSFAFSILKEFFGDMEE